MTLGLPTDAWLLILFSILPGLVLTALYTRKATRLEAARQPKEQG